MRVSRSFLAPLLAAGLALVASACGASANPPTALPLVRTTLVADTVAATERAFSGTIHSRIESDLGFRVDGKISERLVSAGQHVRHGQILMKLDASDYSLAASAATATLAAAQARSSNAQTELKRLTTLLEEGAVSRSAVERMEADARSAAEAVRAASAQARAAANRAAYTTLIADTDGVVTEIKAETGQVVAAGQQVLRLAIDGPRDVEIALPEHFGTLAVGFPATVTFLSDNTKAPSRIRVIAGSADPVTRTYRTRFAIEGDTTAALGATARVSFAESETALAFEAPLSAVHDAGQGPGVWVVDERTSKVRWRPVMVASYGDDTVRIAEGVRRGERVVTLGAHLLSNDQAVRIAKTGDQTIAAK